MSPASPGTVLTNKILGEFGAVPYMRVYRNPVALAWTGQVVERRPSGLVMLAKAVPIHAGLCEGASDLVGIVNAHQQCYNCGAVIRYGAFLAAEVKAGKDRIRPLQQTFLDVVRDLGGISGVVRSVEDFKLLVSPYVSL